MLGVRKLLVSWCLCGEPVLKNETGVEYLRLSLHPSALASGFSGLWSSQEPSYNCPSAPAVSQAHLHRWRTPDRDSCRDRTGSGDRCGPHRRYRGPTRNRTRHRTGSTPKPCPRIRPRASPKSCSASCPMGWAQHREKAAPKTGDTKGSRPLPMTYQGDRLGTSPKHGPRNDNQPSAQPTPQPATRGAD
jgi:hypothetical protein